MSPLNVRSWISGTPPPGFKVANASAVRTSSSPMSGWAAASRPSWSLALAAR
jgi:hypothetical protein